MQAGTILRPSFLHFYFPPTDLSCDACFTEMFIGETKQIADRYYFSFYNK